MKIFKNGLVSLATALIGWLLIGFGLHWLGFIIYLVAFINSLLELKKEFRQSGMKFSEFLVMKIKHVFSKNILQKGAHTIVVVLIPFVFASFCRMLYIQYVCDSIDAFSDAVNDAFSDWE